jgi:diguanylate cyclase (GGDEF)-like protein
LPIVGAARRAKGLKCGGIGGLSFASARTPGVPDDRGTRLVDPGVVQPAVWRVRGERARKERRIRAPVRARESGAKRKKSPGHDTQSGRAPRGDCAHAAVSFSSWPSARAAGQLDGNPIIGLQTAQAMSIESPSPETRSADAPNDSPMARCLFGDAPERRGPLTLTLLAVLVYALFSGVVAWEVHLGLMDAAQGLCWGVLSLSGILGFYALIRSGLSARLGSDPSLTLAQSAFGVAMTALGYAINPALRGAIIAIMMLNLVWGMFVLKDRQALGLCAFALALLAATMAWKGSTDPARFPPRIEALHFTFAVILLVATSALSMRMGGLRARLAERKRELQRALATIRELAQRDELTRLSNRRHVLEMLAHEQVRSARTGEPLAVVLADIDHFKAINDRHGHAVGDAVLQGFAQALRAGLRESDFAGRWGGEEFLLVLPGTHATDAAALVDRLREGTGRLLFDPVAPDLRVGFSAGVAECGPHETLQAAVERADQAMYLAKRAGRGCTRVQPS